MKDFILLMHDDAERSGTPEEWTAYFDRLKASGRFDGGSAIGTGESLRKVGAAGALHTALGGYIRVRAADLNEAKTFVAGNPVFEAGGTVEVRELPKTNSETLANVAERNAIVRQVWPLLIVSDLERSLEFYRDRLGFTLVGTAKSNQKVYWCRLERDSVVVMLEQSEHHDGSAEASDRGVNLYFICDDAQKMYTEFTARGLQLDPPSVAHYGMNQLFVPEPDGYPLCFESPTADWQG